MQNKTDNLFKIVSLLEPKSNVCVILKQFSAHGNMQFGKAIAVLRIDDGTKFMSAT